MKKAQRPIDKHIALALLTGEVYTATNVQRGVVKAAASALRSGVAPVQVLYLLRVYAESTI